MELKHLAEILEALTEGERAEFNAALGGELAIIKGWTVHTDAGGDHPCPVNQIWNGSACVPNIG